MPSQSASDTTSPRAPQASQHTPPTCARGRRPLLHHLNADSSWLLQLPTPSPRGSRPRGTRAYYNILLDPWLSGAQSDVARWFSTQRHAHPPAFPSISRVNTLARQAEDVAHAGNAKEEDGEGVVDAVLLAHEFTDHCHRETLLQLHRRVLVVAPPKAAELVRSWSHFERVVEMMPFGDEEKGMLGVMPQWLRVSRLQDPRDALYYHSAVVVRFKSCEDEMEGDGAAGEEVEECVVYTPHGITPAAAEMMKSIAPSVQPLCLIHGLHDIWLTLAQQLNLGGHNGLQVQRALKAKYWVGTHDEIKIGGGLIAMFLRRKVITVDDALAKESKTMKIEGEGDLEDVYFEEIGNGQTKLLV